jgi:hypothetical protein
MTQRGAAQLARSRNTAQFSHSRPPSAGINAPLAVIALETHGRAFDERERLRLTQ